jgi:hypothetical protein
MISRCYKVSQSLRATRLQQRWRVDGLPTDPNHPWTKNVTEVIRRQLRGFENAWRAGSPHAILDAAAFCGEVKIPPPPWLVIAIETLVARQLLVRSGRGRFNSRQAVFNENQKHYIRRARLSIRSGR